MTSPRKSPLVRSLIAAGILFGAAAGQAGAATFNAPDTSVQMFRWKWNDIARECTNWLGPQGYGAVQVSPPQASASLGTWWDIYQPVNFTSLGSNMGTEAEFQSMITTCHAARVRVYADVVVNHMAAGAGTATNGSGLELRRAELPPTSAARTFILPATSRAATTARPATATA